MNLNEQDIQKLKKALNTSLTTNSNDGVSIEGEPLYANESWGSGHKFSYNVVLPWIVEYLKQRQKQIVWDLLFDEYTNLGSNSLQLFLERISLQLKPQMRSESEFAQSAKEQLKTWRRQRLIRRGYLTIPEKGDIRVVTKSGRPACALLDAIYQQTKTEGGINLAILVHSKIFKKQQGEMLSILKFINNGTLPFCLLNIFTKGRRVSTITLTSYDGIQQNIN